MPAQVFPGQMFIEEKNRAIDIVRNNNANLTLWCNGSKLDQKRAEAAVMEKEDR